MEPRNSVISRKWTYFIFIVTGLTIVLYVLKISGVSFISRETTIRPVSEEEAERAAGDKPVYKMTESSHEVLKTMEDIDQFYGGSAFSTPENNKATVANEEVKYFYQQLKRYYAADPKLQDADRWLAEVKSQKDVYNKVHDIFYLAAKTSGKVFNPSDIGELVKDPVASAQVFQLFKAYFKVAESKSKAFQSQGHQRLGDWAMFVVKTER